MNFLWKLDYVPGDIGNAAKTQVFFTILEESVTIGDRLLVFSQSLFTLSLLEEFLQQRYIPGKIIFIISHFISTHHISNIFNDFLNDFPMDF